MLCCRDIVFAFPAVAALCVLTSCASTKSRPVSNPADFRPLGTVWVQPAIREVMVTGYVNQVDGPIELLACGRTGKTHESVLVLYGKPVDIHAALLLIGLKPGTPMPDVGMGPPTGSPAYIDVEWTENGETRRVPAETLVRDVTTRSAVRNAGWTFNGSQIRDGSYLANMEESLIATYWDPWAIINIGNEVGSDDERLVVNSDRVPPLHTPVRLLIGSSEGASAK